MASAYFGNGSPFSRAIVASTASPLLAQTAIGELGVYKSRGHGGGHYPKAKIGFGYAQHAKARRSHVGAKGPHQGACEITRRAARGLDGQCESRGPHG